MRVMRLVVLTMAAVAFARPAPVDPDIFATMDIINEKVDQLQEELNYARPGHFITALKVLSKTKKVHKALEKGIDVVEEKPVLNIADSTAVAKKVLEEMTPRTTKLVNSLITKKYAFKKVFLIFGDFTGKVKKKILKSKELSVEFGNAVVAKLDPSYRAAGANVTAFIADEFDRALDFYDKKKKKSD